jgi:hypothetical protein
MLCYRLMRQPYLSYCSEEVLFPASSTEQHCTVLLLHCTVALLRPAAGETTGATQRQDVSACSALKGRTVSRQMLCSFGG